MSTCAFGRWPQSTVQTAYLIPAVVLLPAALQGKSWSHIWTMPTDVGRGIRNHSELDLHGSADLSPGRSVAGDIGVAICNSGGTVNFATGSRLS